MTKILKPQEFFDGVNELLDKVIKEEWPNATPEEFDRHKKVVLIGAFGGWFNRPMKQGDDQ